MARASKMKRGRMPSLSELTGQPGGRRFLFVVPPLSGHVRPTVAVGAELLRRGHHVAWAGRRAEVEPLLDPGATLYPIETPDGHQDGSPGQDGPRSMDATVVALAAAMVPGVEAAVEAFGPDVVVVDQQAPAGALAARRRNLPWATSAAVTTELTGPARNAADPLLGELAALQLGHGVTDPMDLRFSDHLVLVFAEPGALGPMEDFPDHFAFVGTATGTADTRAAAGVSEAADRLEKTT